MNEEEFRKILASIRGDCPDADTLIRFQENTLPEATKAQIAEHVKVCGRCANEVRLMREADSESEEMPVSPQEWDRIEERMTARFEGYLDRPIAGVGERESGRVGEWESGRAGERESGRAGEGESGRRRSGFTVSRPVAYAALVVFLALLFPAYVGLREILISEQKTGTLITQVTRLEPAVRGPSATVSVVPGKGDFIGLLFFIPEKRPELARYDCQVLNPNGTAAYAVQDVRSFDGLGNFLLVLSTKALSQDTEYKLVVTERTPDGRQARQWQYPFHVGGK